MNCKQGSKLLLFSVYLSKILEELLFFYALKDQGKSSIQKCIENGRQVQIMSFLARKRGRGIQICINKVLLNSRKNPWLMPAEYNFRFMLEQLPKITNSRLNLSDKIIQKMACSKFERNCTQKVKKLVLSVDGADRPGNSGITVKTLISLSKFDWTNLIELNMWNNKLGAKGCKFLSMASLPKLQTLDLGNNQIDSNGVLHLSKASFGELIELDLSINAINAESVQWLIRLNQKYLKKIWIRKNKIPFNEILKFVLEERRIAHLSVYDNEVEQYSNARIDKTLHQKFGDVNINV